MLVMEHDATEADFLAREHIDEADVVVAALDSDERNVLVSVLSKRLGTNRVLSVVDSADHVPPFEEIGIDVAINPRGVTAEEITRFTHEVVAENSLRQATFQVASLLNSTGYATSDFARRDTNAQLVLLFAMFVGGSAGSAGGGVKMIRRLVVLNAIRRELYVTARPEVAQPIRLGGAVVDEGAVRTVFAFSVPYVALFGVATALIGPDARRVGYELSTLEAVSASIATLGNIGTGFGPLGPFRSYLDFFSLLETADDTADVVRTAGIVPVLALLVGTTRD